MSLGNEEQNALDQFAYANNQSQKTMKKYSRDFLLSFSELDVCKKLPAGFDRSILSEFEDASQDRQNTAGNFTSYSLRRHEYGSSPPTRGVVGPVGRWDSRSSGRSDRDSDSQSDRESDSGKRYGNQSRRPLPVPEHDGLLGSGSFPRSSGSAGGAYAPKFRANGQYQLSKSNEPYHPPRPYKAIPHSRKATNDSYNDETFGSSDYASEDRAEEEKKRRASFEMWRKEQLEASQEKQMKPDKSNAEFDFTELMDSKDEISVTRTNKESDEILLNLNESTRANNPPHSPAFRPPVPPGFGSAVSESNLGPRASSQPQSFQVKNSEFEDLANLKSNLFLSGTPEIRTGELSAENIGWSEKQQENVIDLSVKGNNVISGLGSSKLTSEIAGLDPSASIIDRLFGGALTLNEDHPSHPNEREGEVDEMWASDTVRSSKFAHLFFEEERKQVNDSSSGKPNGLLSLIQGGGMDGSHVSDALTSSTIPQNVLSHSSQPVDGYVLPNLTSSKSELPEQLDNLKNVHKPAEVSAVLTCEDLEKSILSENGENGSVSSVKGWNIPEVKEQQKVPVDNHASHHLLSLLQKADTVDVAPSGSQQPKPSENIDGIRLPTFGRELNDSEMNAKGFPSSGKTLTLESLFGSAFMKELQSVGGSASMQRDAEGSAGLYLLDPNASSDSTNDVVRSSFTGPTRNPYGSNVPLFMEGDNVKSDKHLTRLGGKEPVENLSHFQADKGPSFGEYGRSPNVRLPEEDSLIASDTLNFQNLLSARNSLKDELLTSAEAKVSIKGKVTSLDSIYRDERPLPGSQEYPSFLHSHFDKIEPEFPSRGLHVQPPSQGLNRSQLNHGPLFHPSDPRQANVNSSMNFIRPDGAIPLESPQNHQFPVNMLRPPFPHGSGGPSGFDPPLHHPTLQQMHAPGSFAPSNLQRGFSWSGSPLHATNQLPGFSQDMNPVHGFHPLRGHPSHNSVGISPGPDAGHRGAHPEALQRLLEMELGSKSRQMNAFAPAAQNQGMYGHELDMGFRYR